jgi:hypothetical protein
MEAFRGERRQVPIEPAEKCLLGALGVHVCFLPWAIGTMHVWSQVVSLGLGFVGFVFALRVGGANGRVDFDSPAARLRRFPVFWLGIGLLAYIAIQAANPWMAYVRNQTSWWIIRSIDIPWLPAGIEAPFTEANAWRQLVIYSSAWLVSCSAWAGLTRSRSWRILLGMMIVNGVALAGLLVFQRATGDTRLPWPLTALTNRDNLFASFVYHNHAGAYLGLMTMTAVSMATWGYDRGVRTQKKSTPSAVIGLVALFLGAAVLFTLSRGATLVLGTSLAEFAVWIYLRHRFRPSDSGTDSRVSMVLSIIFGAFIIYVGCSINFSAISNRFDSLIQGRSNEQSVSSRLEARSAGYALLSDYGWRGVGAGGFRYIFPNYVQRYPDIYENGQLFWEHVHDDWLEIPIELGAVGSLLLLALASYFVSICVRNRVVWYSSSVPILFGCLGTLLHAWMDFPFQCPAILVTWCLLVTMACKSLQTEASRKARMRSPREPV